jgi:hypothetical protein
MSLAILAVGVDGSVLSAGYLGRLHVSGLPVAAAAAVRRSVFSGVAVMRVHTEKEAERVGAR